MSMTNLLNSRIIARKGEAPLRFPDLSYAAREKLLNPKLAELAELQKMPTHGDIHDVFAGDWHEKARGRNFIFAVISTEAEARALSELLMEGANPHEDRQFDDWIVKARERGSKIIAVKRERERSYAGYAVVDTSLSLEDHGSEDTPYPTTYLNVSLDCIYISPPKRGKGYSQALSWAAAKHVIDISYAFTEWSDPNRKHLEKYPFEIYIRAEAHSPGGARFMSRTVAEISSAMEVFEPETTWDVIPTISDCCDFSDYADGGFSLRR